MKNVNLSWDAPTVFKSLYVYFCIYIYVCVCASAIQLPFEDESLHDRHRKYVLCAETKLNQCFHVHRSLHIITRILCGFPILYIYICQTMNSMHAVSSTKSLHILFFLQSLISDCHLTKPAFKAKNCTYIRLKKKYRSLHTHIKKHNTVSTLQRLLLQMLPYSYCK